MYVRKDFLTLFTIKIKVYCQSQKRNSVNFKIDQSKRKLTEWTVKKEIEWTVNFEIDIPDTSRQSCIIQQSSFSVSKLLYYQET